MTDKTIPALPAAGALTGAEPIETVQSGSGVKTTAQAIANLAGGSATALLVESGGAEKISNLGAAAGLTGSEEVPVVQSGGTVRTTAQHIADLATGVSALLVESGGAEKISALSAAAPLAGTEIVPLVQGGATVHATAQAIANLASTGMTVTQVAGTSYIFVLADAGTYKQFTSNSPISAGIPTNASVPFPIGTTILGTQDGAGVVSLSAAGGVTLNSYLNKIATAGQFAVFACVKEATNTWKQPSSPPVTGTIASNTASGYPANLCASSSYLNAIGITVDATYLTGTYTVVHSNAGYVSSFNADPKYATQSAYV